MRLLGILCLLLGVFSLNGQTLTPRLEQQLNNEPDEAQLVVIQMADRVDLIALDRTLTENKVDLQERSKTVILALKQKALLSQADLLNFIDGLPLIEVKSIQSYWIGNLIFVKAHPIHIRAIAARSDVDLIDLNVKLEQVEYEDVTCTAAPPAPNGTEPGLRAINAPKLWELGYTGYGRTAFVNDTGVDPTHPALNYKYKGLYVPDSEAWYEFDNPNATPYDCGDHGTHVLGTVLGLEHATNDTIGVAYNANWVGAAILCGIGTQDNIGAFEWAMDPDGDPNTITDIPDVINNSWRDPSINNDCNSVYKGTFDAMEAAGLAVVFSAGNSGPDPESITPPHNINTDLVNSFTVGALNGNSALLLIADFSSRGPSECGGMGSLLIKPEVSAPGQGVRSCVPGNDYGLKSGTSMAAPHVAGAILLLKEAFPYLTGKELKLALYFSCVDLGDPGEDNTYGMGIIDVFAAYEYLIDQGHTPVAPAGQNDALLLSIFSNPYECESTLQANATFKNNNPNDTLTSAQIIFELDGSVIDTFDWTGTLLPFETTVFELPALMVASGTYTTKATLILPNGVADDRPLNNVMESEVQVLDRPYLDVAVLQDVVVCADATAVLTADFPGTGIVRWYNDPTANFPVGFGTTYNTPPLVNNTTFYADLLISHYVGETDIDMIGGTYTDGLFGGLRFDVEQDCNLRSVKVYAEEPGLRQIVLLDFNNDLLYQKFVILNEVGEQRVGLDFELPVGLNYELRLEVGLPLARNTSAVNFPYQVADPDFGDLVEIKASSIPGSNTTTYPFFYDWEVTLEDVCGRIPIEVNVMNSMDSIAAAFTTTADTFFFPDWDVPFTEQAFGASQYFWEFGDGMTSTQMNPTHTYIAPGAYEVVLIAENADGCTDAYSKNIYLSDNGLGTDINNFGVEKVSMIAYPNPANEKLNLEISGYQGNAVISILDARGRLMATFDEDITFSSQLSIQLSNLTSGMYFVHFKGEQIQKAVKFIRQ